MKNSEIHYYFYYTQEFILKYIFHIMFLYFREKVSFEEKPMIG